MMRIRGVWTTNLAALLIGFGMYSAFILIPQFVETSSANGYGFSASVTQGGLFLLPSTVAMIVVSPLAGRLAGIVGSRVPLIAGSLVSAASFLVLAFAHEHRWQLYLATLLLGVGIGLAFAAMANLIVDAVPPQQTGVATGMNTIMRTIGGALGAEIAVSILAASPLAERPPEQPRLHARVRGVGRLAARRHRGVVPRAETEARDARRARARARPRLRSSRVGPVARSVGEECFEAPGLVLELAAGGRRQLLERLEDDAPLLDAPGAGDEAVDEERLRDVAVHGR